MSIERRNVELTIHLIETLQNGKQTQNYTYHIPKAHDVAMNQSGVFPFTNALEWSPQPVTDYGNHTWVYNHLLIPEGSQIAAQDRLEGYLPGMSTEQLDILVRRYLDEKKAG